MEMSNLPTKLKSLKLELGQTSNTCTFGVVQLKHDLIVPHERKQDSRIVSYYFVGHAKCSQRYKFYDATSRSFFKMGNARILEKVEFGKEENIGNVDFEEESVNGIGQILVPITVQETTPIIGDNMDVKTVFLNGDIDKMIYMVQSENFVSNDSKSMKSEGLEIIRYSDSDFAGCQDSKCSTFRYIYMLAGGAIFWKFDKQTLLAPSTMVAEAVNTCCIASLALFVLALVIGPPSPSSATLLVMSSSQTHA
ncbi:hypothetical protein CR513_00561, partial [Mucuna pruriens]